MSRRRFQLHWFIDHYEVGQRPGLTFEQGRTLTFQSIESPRRQSDLLLVFVVGMGFLMDSFVLFTSNAILPMLGYVYWHSATHTSYEVAFNVATLGGCIFGMVLFGFLADHFGRRKLYGIALVVLILGIYGVVTSSVGFTPIDSGLEHDFAQVDWEARGSMDIIAWLLWWRFVSGVGLGGDYPLTATIVAEFAPTVKRGRLLAFVFFMQAIGIAAGSVVTLIVVAAAKSHQPIPDARSIDQVWRWIMGLSLVLACFAMILRLNIPESPRWTLHVQHDQRKAFHEIDRFRNTNLQPQYSTQAHIEMITNANGRHSENPPSSAPGNDQRARAASLGLPSPRQTTREYFESVHDYFWVHRNWRHLAGTCIAWWNLDVAFYALSLNSPQMVAKLWYHAPSEPLKIKVWNAEFDISPDNQDAEIYQILISNSWHSLVVTSAGALVGGAAMIYAVSHFNRRRFQWITFVILGLLFIVTGPVYWKTIFGDEHGIMIALYVACALAFYFGPNTLTFIYPAEIFPTPFRATCHGISAASGKLGSMIIQLILAYFKPNGHRASSIDSVGGNRDSNWLGWLLLGFAIPMFLGALATKKLLPEVQNPDGSPLTLEEIHQRTEIVPRTNGVVNGNPRGRDTRSRARREGRATGPTGPTGQTQTGRDRQTGQTEQEGPSDRIEQVGV